MAKTARPPALSDVALASGMVVSCLQKHEVAIVDREVQGYFDQHLVIRPGDTVFDVGANIGLFTLAVYQRLAEEVDVYAFEPVQAIYDLLAANVLRNVTGGRMQTFAFGLSSRAEESEFAYYPRAPVLSTAYPLDAADVAIVEQAVLHNIRHLEEAPLALRCLRWLPEALRGPIVRLALKPTLRPESVVCRMRTLSQFVAERSIERIDLLKIDAEKAELEIFRGIDALDWPRVRQVVVDVHDEDDRLAVILAMLRGHGLGDIVVDQPPTLTNSNIFTVFAARPH